MFRRPWKALFVVHRLPPPIAVCVTFLAWEPLGKRPLWTCQAPKILGLDIGLTSNFCSRKMRQIRCRMSHPSTCTSKFGVPLECQPFSAGIPVDDQPTTHTPPLPPHQPPTPP